MNHHTETPYVRFFLESSMNVHKRLWYMASYFHRRRPKNLGHRKRAINERLMAEPSPEPDWPRLSHFEPRPLGCRNICNLVGTGALTNHEFTILWDTSVVIGLRKPAKLGTIRVAQRILRGVE